MRKTPVMNRLTGRSRPCDDSHAPGCCSRWSCSVATLGEQSSDSSAKRPTGPSRSGDRRRHNIHGDLSSVDRDYFAVRDLAQIPDVPYLEAKRRLGGLAADAEEAGPRNTDRNREARSLRVQREFHVRPASIGGEDVRGDIAQRPPRIDPQSWTSSARSASRSRPSLRSVW